MLSNAKKNAIAAYVHTGFIAAIGILLNPVLLGLLGPASFGAWKAMQRFLDLGASAGSGGAMQSLKWVIAHRSASASDQEKRQDVGGALIVLCFWSPVLVAVTAATVALLPRLIRGVDGHEMIYLAGALLGVNVVLMSFAAMPDAVLIGTNQGFRSTNISTAMVVVSNVGMLAAASAGLGLPGMAAAMTLATAANGWLTFSVLRRRVSWWGWARPKRSDVRRLSGFSGWILAWSVTMRLSDATELVILSVLAGATTVSAYTFTGYAVMFGSQLCSLTSSSLAPQLGKFVGSKEWLKAKTTAREMRELSLAVATGVGALIILMNQSFVQVWADAQQFMGQGVNVLIVVSFVQSVLIFTDSKIQDTGLEVRGKVIFGTVMTIAALAAGGLTYILWQSVPLMYIAIIATRTIGTVGFPILANRTIQSSNWPVPSAIASGAILAVSTAVSGSIRADNLLEVLCFGLLSAVILGPIVFLMILSPPTRRKVLSRG